MVSWCSLRPTRSSGIIEVKSRVTPSTFRDAVSKLAGDIELVRRHSNIRAFAGLFSYEGSDQDSDAYLRAVADSCETWNRRLDFASIGRSTFIRYWNEDPEASRHMLESWHSYSLRQMSVGYFVSNVVDAVAPGSVGRNRFAWFPHESKEARRTGVQAGQWTTET